MTYQYETKAGFNGTGAWVVYGSSDCFGYQRRINLFSTERECIEFIEAGV